MWDFYRNVGFYINGVYRTLLLADETPLTLLQILRLRSFRFRIHAQNVSKAGLHASAAANTPITDHNLVNTGHTFFLLPGSGVLLILF